MTGRPNPVMLVILDGWGHSDSAENNAIMAAKTPTWDMLMEHYPNGLINASELHVGLPSGQMGNSEVGHMNIGSGRRVMQELPRIDAAIADGSLAKRPQLLEFIAKLKASGGTCHLMGLVSPGGVHSHQHHIATLASIVSQQGVPVRIHAFLDGRDTPPQSADKYMAILEKDIATLPDTCVATVGGRYYAMDRDQRWDRVQLAYDAITGMQGMPRDDSASAIAASYAKKETDEFVKPCVIGDYKGMRDGDGVLVANFRADRVRQLLTALVDPAFEVFGRKRTVRFAATLGMVQYSSWLATLVPAIFPPEKLTDILGEVISKHGLKQLRIAETEKYAHVTFFFNGGREEKFHGEDRILVPSPKVATYDLQPEMSAPEVTDKLVQEIEGGAYDLIVVNYANTDMVGHTGNVSAAIKAVEAVDKCLGRLHKAITQAGGAMLITADHGNAEQMYDPSTGQSHTAHTLNLVPVIIVAERFCDRHFELPEGALGDIAPTILTLMGLPKPAGMTGHSLLAGHA
ncbi:MAG: 2,3-bisphosphoglycerate-independent phosphoglycerate mutase [Alphaproteobacteria bacterium]